MARTITAAAITAGVAALPEILRMEGHYRCPDGRSSSGRRAAVPA
jgi:hypothetical protein